MESVRSSIECLVLDWECVTCSLKRRGEGSSYGFNSATRVQSRKWILLESCYMFKLHASNYMRQDYFVVQIDQFSSFFSSGLTRLVSLNRHVFFDLNHNFGSHSDITPLFVLAAIP